MAAGLFVFSLFCLFAFEPKTTGYVVALVLLITCAAESVAQGFVTRVTFHRLARQATVTRTFFGRPLTCREFPLGDVSLSLESFVGPSSQATRATPVLYTVTMGAKTYLLALPRYFYPATFEKLRQVRAKLGFK